MYDVFINYRTGDGDEAAAMIEKVLSERFGKKRIFRAARSIAPGSPYPEALLDAVRHSAILVAVIGAEWSQYPQLRDESDWVRREILEAYTYGIRIIPVLKGRKTDRLKAADLPVELTRLADLQSLRLDMRDNQADLVRIGDELAALVPSLKAADRVASRSSALATVHNSASDIHGTAAQSHGITADVGAIKGNHGQVHAGKGNIYQDSQHFSGPGATYIKGDNHEGISHRFGGQDTEEDERD